MTPAREFDPTLDTPAVRCPDVIWQQVPEVLRMFVVKARLAGLPVRIGIVDRIGGGQKHVVVGPRGYISDAGGDQLLCSCQSVLEGILGYGLRKTSEARTYLFGSKDEPACCAALVNIGVAELPKKFDPNNFAAITKPVSWRPTARRRGK